MKELINLTIINDSDCTLSIPLFQNNVASINATTKYQWDVTSANISCGYGTIIINGSLISITYVPTLTGLVDSLNALNYGYFCTEVIGANTYIYTKDNTNTYSLLDLCPTPTTTTTTTTTSSTSTTTTIAPTTTSTTTTTTTALWCDGSGGGHGTGLGCKNWNIIAGGAGAVVTVIDCSGASSSVTLIAFATGNLCACSGVTPTIIAGSATLNQVGDCVPTTTSTTTTTTTILP